MKTFTKALDTVTRMPAWLPATMVVMTLWLAACAGMTRVPEPESPQALVYQANCSACHGLPHPHRHTFAQWQHLLVLMEARIRERGMTPLSPDDRETILHYLKKNARPD